AADPPGAPPAAAAPAPHRLPLRDEDPGTAATARRNRQSSRPATGRPAGTRPGTPDVPGSPGGSRSADTHRARSEPARVASRSDVPPPRSQHAATAAVPPRRVWEVGYLPVAA